MKVVPTSAFWYWMEEREGIRILKESGQPSPWTDDPILHKYRFTNVFRERDKGTVALREMTPHVYTYQECIFNVFWYRILNRFEHATDIGWMHDFDGFAERIRAKRLRKAKIWTAAHRIWAPKHKPILEYYLDVLYDVWDIRHEMVDKLTKCTSLEGAFNYVMELDFRGIGKFLSYEIVTDWRHMSLFQAKCDIMSWCSIGPGSARGLQRLGMEPTVESVQVLLEQVPGVYEDTVEMRDIEHSLCEFDKYQRVLQNEGRPRGVYNHG